jgi:hypothetical protein
MNHWWDDEDETLNQGKKFVPINRLKALYTLLLSMLCWIYGEEKTTHFHTHWLPLSHTIVKTGKVFNLTNTLAFNICLHMKKI